MKQIEKYCHEFLQLHFGNAGEQPELQDLGLRLVSLGNAEKTVQGALLSFLNSKLERCVAVSECGIYSPTARRNLDLTVFDEQWRVVCVIELKHYSKNQGGPAFLVNGLQADSERHSEIFESNAPPLIQIGLYTEIVKINLPYENVDVKCVEDMGFYRFIKTYCDGAHGVPPLQQVAAENGWDFVLPAISNFNLNNRIVTGRVNYCIRML